MTRFILLDIEGTTSSIQFVYDVLFPYVRSALPGYLDAHWNDGDLRGACERLARDAVDEWNRGSDDAQSKRLILTEALRLMDMDSKATSLKEIQGLVSREGYVLGKLRSHFYPDVKPALERWTRDGVTCCVYSSGSIEAQRNFYRYADCGDLSGFITAWFDTTTGPKRETRSYEAIAAALNAPSDTVQFCSDVVEELNAARSAGMLTALIVRPGDKPVRDGHGHRVVHALTEL